MSSIKHSLILAALIASLFTVSCKDDDSGENDAGVDSGPVDLCAPMGTYLESCEITGADLEAHLEFCAMVQDVLTEEFTTSFIGCVNGTECTDLNGVAPADGGPAADGVNTCYWNTSGSLEPPQANKDLADAYCQFYEDCVSIDKAECLAGWEADDPASMFLKEEHVSAMAVCVEDVYYCQNDFTEVDTCFWDVINSLELFDDAE